MKILDAVIEVSANVSRAISELQKLNRAQKQITTEQRNQVAASRAASAAAAQQRAELRKVREEERRLALDRRKNMRMLGIGAGAAGAGYLGAGYMAAGGLGAGIAKVVGAGAEFEKQMKTLQAATDETAANMALLEEKALSLDKVGPHGPIKLAEAMVVLAKNGIATKDILDGALESTALLSTAMGEDLATSADFITDIMQQYKIKAEDLDDAINTLVGTANASKFGMNDLWLAFSQGGGIAASLGFELEETATAIASLSHMFKSGSDAGTSFKVFLQRLYADTKPAKEIAKKYGLNFFDKEGNFLPMEGIIEEIRSMRKKNGDRLSAKELSAIYAPYFGIDAARVFLGFYDMKQDEWEKVLTSIRKGDAKKMAKIMSEGLIPEWAGLKKAFQEFSIAIFESGLGDFLVKLVRGTKDAVVAVTELVRYWSKMGQLPGMNVLRGLVGLMGDFGVQTAVTVAGLYGMLKVFQLLGRNKFILLIWLAVEAITVLLDLIRAFGGDKEAIARLEAQFGTLKKGIDDLVAYAKVKMAELWNEIHNSMPSWLQAFFKNDGKTSVEIRDDLEKHRSEWERKYYEQKRIFAGGGIISQSNESSMGTNELIQNTDTTIGELATALAAIASNLREVGPPQRPWTASSPFPMANPRGMTLGTPLTVSGTTIHVTIHEAQSGLEGVGKTIAGFVPGAIWDSLKLGSNN